MKQSILGLAALAIGSAAAFAQNSDCRLSGDLPEPSLAGKTIYVVDYDTNEKLDSATVKNGKISFATSVAGRALPAALMIDGRKAITFILEPAELTLNERGQVKGGPLNDKNEAIALTLDSLYQSYRDQVRALISSGKPREEVSRMAEEYQQQISQKTTDLLLSEFERNKDNAVGYILFLQMADGMTADQLRATLAGCPEWMQASRAAKTYMEMAENLEKTAPGKMFTDFEVTTSDGKTARLSDYVGKGEYVLLDFFASWCGPCMREIPNLKAIYERYNGKGLKMVGLAVWDEPADTRRCVEEQKLPWTIIDNAQRVPTDIYGVRGIPHIIVFSPDGTIAFRGLTGERLSAAIDNLFGQKQ